LEACRKNGVGGIKLLLGTLVAQAHHDVRIPAAALHDEVPACVERDAVLAPVEVAVPFRVRVLVVELGIDRPVRVDELADADRTERRVAGIAVVVLDIHSDGAGEVPAIIELLRAGSSGQTQAADKSGTEELLVHMFLLNVRPRYRTR